jgi:hypothetical protein
MFYSSTTDFILSPLSNILAEAAFAISNVGNKMNNYQIADWVMPTVFLRMTGAQEQKCKSINWDLGTIDLEHRLTRMMDKQGDMSCYDDKFKLCSDLTASLLRNSQRFDPSTDIDRETIMKETREDIVRLCSTSLMTTWYGDYYKDFEDVTEGFRKEEFFDWDESSGKLKAMLKGDIRMAYEAMYRHRIRCAHNTNSWQPNLPRFTVLSGPASVYENYFIRFYLLVLLDKLFVQLYKTAIECVELSV